MLETQRLRLRAWRPEDDARDALTMYEDPEVVRFLGGATLRDLAHAADFLTRRTARVGPRERFDRVSLTSGELVGTGILDRIPLADGSLSEDVQVGVHLRPMHWGRGYAQEICRALMAYGFDVLGLERIELLIEPGNDASLRLAERLGATYLGETTRWYDLAMHHWRALRP